MGFHGALVGSNGDSWRFNLWSTYKKLWKTTKDIGENKLQSVETKKIDQASFLNVKLHFF
jgi:hypothetical protein